MKRRFTPLHNTAYHEAGHAVISAAVRWPVTKVTILPDESKGTGGGCHHPVSLDKLTADGTRDAAGPVLRDIAIYMAATIAESTVRRRSPTWTAVTGLGDFYVINGKKTPLRDSAGDLGEAVDRLLHLTGDDGDEYVRLSSRVWRLTVREVRARWPQVRAVAETLLEKRTLCGRSVLKIIRENGRRSGPLSAGLSEIACERRLSLAKHRRRSKGG